MRAACVDSAWSWVISFFVQGRRMQGIEPAAVGFGDQLASLGHGPTDSGAPRSFKLASGKPRGPNVLGSATLSLGEPLRALVRGHTAREYPPPSYYTLRVGRGANPAIRVQTGARQRASLHGSSGRSVAGEGLKRHASHPDVRSALAAFARQLLMCLVFLAALTALRLAILRHHRSWEGLHGREREAERDHLPALAACVVVCTNLLDVP